MSNVVEFVLKLKDMMSSGMSRVAATAQSAMARVETATRRAGSSSTRSISALNDQLDKLRKTRDLSVDTRQIRAANREIDRVQQRMERLENMGRRAQSSGGMGIGLGGALTIGAGALAIGAGVGTALSAGMQGGAQKVSFETMAGVTDGSKLYTDLTKFAQDSIFGNELYGNAQTMLAFGASAKDVMPDLKMLGDISMGNKEKMGSLTLAYSQIRATGRLMGQDLLQLVTAGFNPLQIISEKTGVGMAELKKRMEDGAISFDMVKQAFEAATGPGGRFFDMTNKIAETPFGMWEALKGQISGIALQFGANLLPAIQPVLKVLPDMATKFGILVTQYGVPFIQFLVDSALWLKNNSDWLGMVVTVVGTAIGVVKVITIVTGLWTKAQMLLNAVMMANPISIVITAVAALVAGIIYAYQKFDGFREFVNRAWSALSEFASQIKEVVIDRLKTLLSGITGIGQSLYLLFTGEFKEAFRVGKEAVLDLTGVNTAVKAYEGAKKVGEAWTNGVAKGIANAAGGLAGTMAATMQGAIKRGNMLPEVIVKPTKSPAPKPQPFSTQTEPSLMKDKGDRMTGGGVRAITINLGKFFDNIILNGIRGSDESAEAVADKTGEALLKMLYSAGAMQ